MSDDPDRECRHPPGTYVPLVNRSKCEGKSECVPACPYDVFEVRRIDDGDYGALPFLARLKVRAHGMKSAYTPRASLCRACAKCVTACPERAITLRRVAPL